MEIRAVQPFLEYWDSLRGRTRRVVACIPPEHLEWSHRAGAFTLGDLVRHLATIQRYMYAETVAGRPSSYPGCGRDLADGYDDVVAYFDRLDAREPRDHRRARRCGPRAQVPHAGRHADHHLEVAAIDVRARSPSPRPDLPDARDARRRPRRRCMA